MTRPPTLLVGWPNDTCTLHSFLRMLTDRSKQSVVQLRWSESRIRVKWVSAIWATQVSNFIDKLPTKFTWLNAQKSKPIASIFLTNCQFCQLMTTARSWDSKARFKSQLVYRKFYARIKSQWWLRICQRMQMSTCLTFRRVTSLFQPRTVFTIICSITRF